jgi:enamine deaminase RidA (YjgF/YER057c/UK114 family)
VKRANEIRPIVAPDAPNPSSAGAEAVLLNAPNNILFLSGQIGMDREQNVPADFVGQCRQAWANVEAQLRAAGSSLDDVIKVTTFVADRRFADENMTIRNEIMGKRRFANTVVIAGLYDSAWQIEVEVVAAW